MDHDGDLEGQILTALRRIMRAVDLHSRRLAKDHGLTVPQLFCLRELRQADGLTLGDLSRAVSLSPATVTGILGRLEARGLVRRERGRRDRRRVRAYLSPAGLRLVETAPAPLQEAFSHRLGDLDEPDQAALLASLERIVDMMGASDLDAAPLLSSGPPHAAPARPKHGTSEADPDDPAY